MYLFGVPVDSRRGGHLRGLDVGAEVPDNFVNLVDADSGSNSYLMNDTIGII